MDGLGHEGQQAKFGGDDAVQHLVRSMRVVPGAVRRDEPFDLRGNCADFSGFRMDAQQDPAFAVSPDQRDEADIDVGQDIRIDIVVSKVRLAALREIVDVIPQTPVLGELVEPAHLLAHCTEQALGLLVAVHQFVFGEAVEQREMGDDGRQHEPQHDSRRHDQEQHPPQAVQRDGTAPGLVRGARQGEGSGQRNGWSGWRFN